MACPVHLFRFSDLVCALLCALFLVTGQPALAQTVSNTAQATWRDQGQDYLVRSNTVAFEVVRPPVRIETLHAQAGEGIPSSMHPSTCGGHSLPVSMAASASEEPAIAPSTAINAGELLYFRLEVRDRNINPLIIDSLQVTVTSTRGDREVITVLETAVNSGIFAGAVPTSRSPAIPAQSDCRISVETGETVTIAYQDGAQTATASVSILADPYGLVFDSEDGAPVNGATVTLVDATTGAPAQVFADDGITAWPSTVISGQTITDAAGNANPMAPGEYRFPLAPLGSYRIVVTPPAPYTAPSAATPAQLSGLTRPDGGPLLIVPGSYGQSFLLNSPAPVRIDIPVDRPSLTVGLAKSASRAVALPGDAILYTIRVTNPDPARAKRQVVITDTPAQSLRLRRETVRIDGQDAASAVSIAADGRSLQIAVGTVLPGATRTITYAATVRPDASPGQALNRAEAVDSRGNRVIASAAIRVDRESIAGRMTIIGRVIDGACGDRAAARGIAGVRIMLEDGSFALTDADGRYHFEGVVPGTHVVQAASETLPEGGKLVDCARSTRSLGSARSRLVTGHGGDLAVVDFAADLQAVIPQAQHLATAEISERAAAGAETDWLAFGDGPAAFLFPAIDHNPRAPAVRVVIRHRKGETVTLLSDGKPVDALTFDGVQVSPQGYAVSIWRGVALSNETTQFSAIVRDSAGTTTAELSRSVHFAATPARVELLSDRSRLVADGATRSVIAVRIQDRLGRPVHAGLTGGFAVNDPYESAVQRDALQSRQLSGLDRAAPTWTVLGDDGVAMIELAPTMVSGALRLEFNFNDGEVSRRETLEAWMTPGDQKWTLVALAEGAIGARSIADNMERADRFDSDLGKQARVAFYAKGRVLGRFLITAAYDSAKQKDDQRLLGAIDPNAYYTVFADGSDRRFDAASREKLYVRIEGRTFYALYGDFVTGFDQTELARYQRTMTGAKAEGTFGALAVQGFAAKTGDIHRRDEIQGAGISGPYRLSSRAIVANSESVTIEVRDRFRSELVLDRRTLTRFIDYDVDLLAGTITFKEPILSRTAMLDPQFIVVDYEIERAEGGALNGGIRAALTTKDGNLRIAASAITDTSRASGDRANLAAVDLKANLSEATELRAEAAVSRVASANSHAWLVEMEHHSGKLDLLGYVRSADRDFGLGQLNLAQQGRRKAGLDARYRVDEALSLNASAWYDDSLTDATHRRALEIAGTYRTRNTDTRVGLTDFSDRLQDGTRANSTVLDAAVTQRLFDNRLEITGAASVALGKAESIDLPARYQFGLRYAINPAIKVSGTYEIAEGEAVRARTARVGVEVSPWAGARVQGALGRQAIAENGNRSFAAFGLTQSIEINRELMVDLTVDSSRTLGRFDALRLIDPAHPAASGGQIGDGNSLTEDFTAVTLGGTWRRQLWTATLRGEYRDGQLANRKGMTFGLIRQLGDGSALGAGFNWTKADAVGGASSEVFDGAVSAAFRPAHAPIALLTKLEFRSDAVTGAVAGEAGPAGRTALTIDGDARARRLIASVSSSWTPPSQADGMRVQRSEVRVFTAVRHNFDRFEGFDLSGTTLIGGGDVRIGLGDRLEIGVGATVRHGVQDGTTSYAIGPRIGFSPTNDMLLTVGYNFSGFHDRDFAAARSTNRGVFATLTMKLDADSLGLSELGRR